MTQLIVSIDDTTVLADLKKAIKGSATAHVG